MGRGGASQATVCRATRGTWPGAIRSGAGAILSGLPLGCGQEHKDGEMREASMKQCLVRDESENPVRGEEWEECGSRCADLHRRPPEERAGRLV